MSHCQKRLAINLVIIAGVIGFVDGFVHRDPYVKLAHGYAIGSISWSSPCELWHSVSEDDRNYSDWLAMTSSGDDGQPVKYLLVGKGRRLTFDTEEAWREAVLEKHAQPGEIAAKLPGVTGFRGDRNFAIGTFEGGYFLLDMLSHDLLVTKSEEDWERAVALRTSLNPHWLRNPKNFFVQSRIPFAVPTYLILVGVALFMSWLECRREKQLPSTQSA